MSRLTSTLFVLVAMVFLHVSNAQIFGIPQTTDETQTTDNPQSSTSPVSCPSGMEWNPCGSACPPTCSNLNSTCEKKCVPRCECGDGFVENDQNMCIPPMFC